MHLKALQKKPTRERITLTAAVLVRLCPIVLKHWEYPERGGEGRGKNREWRSRVEREIPNFVITRTVCSVTLKRKKKNTPLEQALIEETLLCRKRGRGKKNKKQKTLNRTNSCRRGGREGLSKTLKKAS